MSKRMFGFGTRDMINAELVARPSFVQRFIAQTMWGIEHQRRGRRGFLYEWKDVAPMTWDHNICTAEGINGLLDIMFHAAPQISTWYILLFESDTTPADGTTYATPVFTESTAYDEATRQEYVEAGATGKVITNTANKATFTMSATKTIYGGALVGGGTGASTKSDTAGGGKLFCASKFTASKAVVNDDVLRVTVAITGADT